MPENSRITTTVSAKGQIVLPKPIRKTRHWKAGTRLLVEDRPDGVLLKAYPHFPETHPKQVFGCLAYKGEAKSTDEMEAASERAN